MEKLELKMYSTFDQVVLKYLENDGSHVDLLFYGKGIQQMSSILQHNCHISGGDPVSIPDSKGGIICIQQLNCTLSVLLKPCFLIIPVSTLAT